MNFRFGIWNIRLTTVLGAIEPDSSVDRFITDGNRLIGKRWISIEVFTWRVNHAVA